jgi:hypothetical protein
VINIPHKIPLLYQKNLVLAMPLPSSSWLIRSTLKTRNSKRSLTILTTMGLVHLLKSVKQLLPLRLLEHRVNEISIIIGNYGKKNLIEAILPV